MDKKIHRKDFISEIDKFIQEFESERQDPLCASRQLEIQKHQKIFDRRDNAIASVKDIFEDDAQKP